MRLIDADKLIEEYAHYGKDHSYDVSDLEDIVNECPTVDVFENVITEIEKCVWEDVLRVDDGTDEIRIPFLDPDDVFRILAKYAGVEEC